MKNLLLFLLFITSIFIFAEPVINEFPNLTIVTEDWEPYHYLKNNQKQGSIIDLTTIILKNLHSKQTKEDVNIYPWTRAYNLALTKPNTLIFSMVRNDERENSFHWIGPIFQVNLYFIAKKSSNIKIKSKEDIKKYKISVTKDDVSEIYIKDYNVPENNIYVAPKWKDGFNILTNGRVDLWINTWYSFLQGAEIYNIDPDDYEKVYLVDSTDIYYGFSLTTPEYVVEDFRKEFNNLKNSDHYNSIIPDF